MIKVLTAQQMREVDRLTTERYSIPSILLMESAAHAVARVIAEKLGGSVKGKSVLILCGKGNNGGDGAALARILWTQGVNITVCMMYADEEYRGDAKMNLELLRNLHRGQTPFSEPSICVAEVGTHRSFFDRLDAFMGPDVVVDALFGTGLERPLSDEHALLAKSYRSLILTEQRPIFISIDIPSGIDAGHPDLIGEAFEADITVTFTRPKPANILPPAANLGGELVVIDIGSPLELIAEQPSQLFLAQYKDAAAWIKKTEFTNRSYKNKRGHALIVAGSEDYSGAAVMCGNSAMRSGVGLTTLLVPASCKVEVASRVIPEVIVRSFSGPKEVLNPDAFAENQYLLRHADSILVGPGLAPTDIDIERFVWEIVETRTRPVIVDASILGFFSPPVGFPEWNKTGNTRAEMPAVRPPLILTPHEGEFLRLLGTVDKSEIKDRVAAVREFAVANGVILVLKGERVLIGSPDGRVVVNPTGNSGLGKAGNGDTLAGILVGFAAQAVKFEIDIFETVVAAVYVAGMAGDVAEKKFGKRVMTASDVRECLVDVFAEFE